MPANTPHSQSADPAQTQSGGVGGVVAWLVLAIAALLFVAYVVWRQRPAEPMGIDYPAVGQSLLYFELEPLTGGANQLTLADLRGKVTLINIWGTWCPPCAEEFPYLAAIYDKLNEHAEFQFVSVSYDDKPVEELKEATREFLERMRTNHPTYYDPGTKTLQGLYMIGVEDSFPTTLVLDKTGALRGVWLGYNRQSIVEIEGLVNELLH